MRSGVNSRLRVFAALASFRLRSASSCSADEEPGALCLSVGADRGRLVGRLGDQIFGDPLGRQQHCTDRLGVRRRLGDGLVSSSTFAR